MSILKIKEVKMPGIKKFYKCRVCGDIHYGVNPPKTCPTCLTDNAYNEIKKEGAKKVMF